MIEVQTTSGADPLVRRRPPGRLVRIGAHYSPEAGRRGRRPRTRGSAPLLLLFALTPVFADTMINLWPDPAAVAGTEVWVERGKGTVDRAVSSVHQPAITVYLPEKENATGAAIVIAPGGGFSHLAIDKEGHEIARWLTKIGVAGFVLKYRLPKTKDAGYTIDTALRDTQRALRLVRSRAREWNVDTTRVGLMGFSAGGALAALAGAKFDDGSANAADPIDRESSRPDFLVTNGDNGEYPSPMKHFEIGE